MLRYPGDSLFTQKDTSDVADTLSTAISAMQDAVLAGKQSARDALHTAAPGMNRTLSAYYAESS